MFGLHDTGSPARWLCAALALALAVPSCADEEPTDDGLGPVPPTLDVELAPAAVAVAAGDAVTLVATVRGDTALTTPLRMEAYGVPRGMHVLFADRGAHAWDVTLDTETGLVPGHYAVRITAARAGARTGSASVQVTVTAGGGAEDEDGFEVTVDGGYVSVLPGGEPTTWRIWVRRTGAFTGPVALELFDVPAGLTATVEPAVVAGVSATLRLEADAALEPKTYTIGIVGRAEGLTGKTFPITVVTEEPNGFRLSVAPAALTVTAGSSVQATVGLVPFGAWQGTVLLGPSTTPNGMTMAFAPAQITGSETSTLTVSTERSLAPGTYEITAWGFTDVDWVGENIEVTVLPAP